MTRWALGLRAWLTEVEVGQVLGLARKRAGRLGRRGGESGHVTLLAVRLGLECGLRASELCGLRVGDVTVDEGVEATVHVGNGKCGSNGAVMMPAGLAGHVRGYLSAYRAGAGPGERLLRGRGRESLHRLRLAKRMKKLLADALGLERSRELAPCHCLRHTCAVLAYKATRDLVLVQKHLRHQSVKVTQIYADVCSQERRAGIEKAFGGLSLA